MEMAMEVEDDLFFADLSRQISLLIMDEEEDDRPVAFNNTAVSLHQAFYLGFHPPAVNSFASYETALTRGSKGTGVFIPRSLQPRRKRRQTKSSSSSHNVKSNTPRADNSTRIKFQVSSKCPLHQRRG